MVTATQLLSRDGDALSGDYTTGNTGLAGGAPSLQVRSASILDLPTRQDITGALVLIDTTSAMGKTLNQLADYAAMRALAKTNAAASADDDTILSLFADAGSPPRQLTSFDTAFLRALYHGPATAKFDSKVAQITNQIAAEQQ